MVKCSNPDCPHEVSLKFNRWVRRELPDSGLGFVATDIDFIFYNYETKQVAVIEVKTHNSTISFSQKEVLQNITKWIRKGIDGFKYMGSYLVVFENTFFNDGRCYLNGREITEAQLKELFSKI